VSPRAGPGSKIVACIEAWNAGETSVQLNAPDTVVISQPHYQVLGTGTFILTVEWKVLHARQGTSTLIEILAAADSLHQVGNCLVVA
jgi:hypothetical protein